MKNYNYNTDSKHDNREDKYKKNIISSIVILNTCKGICQNNKTLTCFADNKGEGFSLSHHL